ncbi:MAG: type II toxin-antitoxin system Phd/YefM family antitoxin [Ardenticatenaceae bacterium]|nr:type II toxin-antitoxin system Phd/YefM family antitoxin [Ardenticatenaceae bacterium]
MKTITVAQLHGDIDNLLQEVWDTGVPIEVIKGNQKLRVIPVVPIDKFANLVHRPDVINGDSEELACLKWDETL